jgi:hypothetical protein
MSPQPGDGAAYGDLYIGAVAAHRLHHLTALRGWDDVASQRDKASRAEGRDSVMATGHNSMPSDPDRILAIDTAVRKTMPYSTARGVAAARGADSPTPIGGRSLPIGRSVIGLQLVEPRLGQGF